MVILPAMSAITPEESAASKARQQRRYRDAHALKQYEEREHLRGEIPSRKIVQMNSKIMEILIKGNEDVVTPSGEILVQELDSTRANCLKAAADIGFKFLSKTVPDLKQIELRADVSEEALPQAITFTVVRAGGENDDDDDDDDDDDFNIPGGSV